MDRADAKGVLKWILQTWPGSSDWNDPEFAASCEGPSDYRAALDAIEACRVPRERLQLELHKRRREHKTPYLGLKDILDAIGVCQSEASRAGQGNGFWDRVQRIASDRPLDWARARLVLVGRCYREFARTDAEGNPDDTRARAMAAAVAGRSDARLTHEAARAAIAILDKADLHGWDGWGAYAAEAQNRGWRRVGSGVWHKDSPMYAAAQREAVPA